jgi:hypothetical protein
MIPFLNIKLVSKSKMARGACGSDLLSAGSYSRGSGGGYVGMWDAWNGERGRAVSSMACSVLN